MADIDITRLVIWGGITAGIILVTILSYIRLNKPK